MIAEQEEQAERVGPTKIITLGKGVPTHETVRLSCQPQGDEWPKERCVLEKTASADENKKGGDAPSPCEKERDGFRDISIYRRAGN